MITNNTIILLTSNNFDFYYLKKIINELLIQKVNFQIWNLEFLKKKQNKSYQKITTKNHYLKKKNLKIFKYKNIENFIRKIKSSKFLYFLSLEPLEDNNLYHDKEFLKKINIRFGIIQKGDDYYANFLNKKFLDLNKYNPTLFSISRYKYKRSLNFLKNKIKINLFRQLKYQKKIFTGYFFTKNYSSKNKNKNLIIYFPYYSNLVLGNNQFSNALAFYKIYEKKKTSESIFKYILKKMFFIILILKSFRSIRIFLCYNEKKILKEIYNFCRKFNFKLVIKSRKKNQLNNYHFQYSDKVINDDHVKQDPNYLEELLPKTFLSICYSSQAIYDSIFNNVPVLNINNLNYSLIKRDTELIDQSKKSEFNYPDIITLLNEKEFLKKILKLNPKDIFFSKNQRNKYLKKILNLKNNIFGEKKIIKEILKFK